MCQLTSIYSIRKYSLPFHSLEATAMKPFQAKGSLWGSLRTALESLLGHLICFKERSLMQSRVPVWKNWMYEAVTKCKLRGITLSVSFDGHVNSHIAAQCKHSSLMPWFRSQSVNKQEERGGIIGSSLHNMLHKSRQMDWWTDFWNR